MPLWLKYLMLKPLYLTRRFYYLMSADIVLFALGYFFSLSYAVARGFLFLFIVFGLFDLLLLFARRNGLRADRRIGERLSNGDHNPVEISITNDYDFPIDVEIIDEIPEQFQKRDFLIKSRLGRKSTKAFHYTLRPTSRGEYHFGRINAYALSIIGLFKRRYIVPAEVMTPVYPSFIQMRKYELMAISNRLVEAGVKKIRRIANNREFEQIREYVVGDDQRTINWKATARRAQLMVNQYQDERSQQVYSLIDMGRTMKSPFDGLTLLDYAINASLVISNIAILKHDKAGLISFSKQIHSIVPASRSNRQMSNIMEVLYNQDTLFDEANYEALYSTVRYKIQHRSLLLLYTNFEGLPSMRRQLPFFKRLAMSHLLVVIFFENTLMKEILHLPPKHTLGIYTKAIAEKFVSEKRQIVKELNRHGIHAILTEPALLTVNTINKYLELKAMGLI